MRQGKIAQKSERNFERKKTNCYDNCIFQNLGGQYAIILGMKNGFVMIKSSKNRGAIYKKVLTNENKKIIIGLEIK